MSKLFEGKALIVDLVFGLPLVLAMAIVVYASVYWLLKLIVIFLLPQAIIQINSDQDLEHSLEDAELEKIHGKEYWKEADNTLDKPKNHSSKEALNEDEKSR